MSAPVMIALLILNSILSELFRFQKWIHVIESWGDYSTVRQLPRLQPRLELLPGVEHNLDQGGPRLIQGSLDLLYLLNSVDTYAWNTVSEPHFDIVGERDPAARVCSGDSSEKVT